MDSEQNFSNTCSEKDMPSGHALDITQDGGWSGPRLFKDFVDLLGELESGTHSKG